MVADKFVAMRVKSANWRGVYIDSFAFLEKLIDEYLSRYFCGKDEKLKKDLMELVLCEKLTFENKRAVFSYVLKNKNIEIVTTYSKLLKDIEIANNNRNVFAHYMLDTSEYGEKMFEESKLVFVKFSYKDNVVISDEDFLNMHSALQKCIEILSSILA